MWMFAGRDIKVLFRWETSQMYKKQLQFQIAEQEEQKRLAYEDFLKEKLLIDEIVRKIYDEDQREAEERMRKRDQVYYIYVKFYRFNIKIIS